MPAANREMRGSFGEASLSPKGQMKVSIALKRVERGTQHVSSEKRSI